MLIEVTERDAAFLYRLLSERPHPISHAGMPSWDEHLQFVRHHPYRFWYLIAHADTSFGSIYLGHDNSVGVVIAKEFQRMGMARAAIKQLLDRHAPLPAIPSVRSGSYIANIAPDNHGSKALFQSLGFNLIQETYRHG